MEEKNKHILERAIGELASYDPPSSLWEKIENQLPPEEKTSLYQGGQNLPQYEPGPNLWSKIEEKLNENINEKGRVYLTKALLDLLVYTPSEQTWRAIENKLPVKSVKIISIKRWSYPLSIAASFLLLFSTYWYFKHPGIDEKISITYAQEIVETQTLIDQQQPSIDVSGGNDGVLELVETHCTSIPDACKNPYLSNLILQYKELKATQEKLLQDAADNSDDLHLKKALVKIEKEKTKVAKKVIQYIV